MLESTKIVTSSGANSPAQTARDEVVVTSTASISAPETASPPVESTVETRHTTGNRASSHRATGWAKDAPLLVTAAFVGTMSVLLVVSPPPLLSRPQVGAPTAQMMMSQTTSAENGNAAGGVLPVSQTFVATMRPSSGAILRGQVRASRGTVIGQAPLSGQVSRVLVQAGRNVDVGDRILDLSTSGGAPAPRRAERQQSAAEQAQVAAVAKQQALEAKMNGARVRFVAAQQRVAAANRRLDEARDMLSKLKKGEPVSAPKSVAKVPRKAPRRAVERATLAVDSTRDAMAEAIKLQREADAAALKSRNAFYAASSADNASRQKKTRVDVAREQLQQVEARFAVTEAKASDVEAARGALAEAQSEAKDAADKASSARREASAMQALRDAAKSRARAAAARAAQAQQKAQDRSEVAVEAMPQATEAVVSEGLSIGDAARLVSSAVAESDAASLQARRLKTEVDAYQRQVEITRARLESSTQQLNSAQQNVVEDTIRAGLSEVRAPAAGVVLSVASVAQQVAAGEAVVTIGRPARREVVLNDSSSAWRTLKEGSELTATTEGDGTQAVGTPVALRIAEIEAPRDKSTPARLTASIIGSNAVDLRAGTRVSCTVAPPGSRRALWIPTEAIVADGSGRRLVAVLQPTAQSLSSGAMDLSSTPRGDEYRLEWRTVTLAKNSPDQAEIRSGLREGERIVMQAAAWRDWTAIHGNDAVVRMETI